MPAYDPSMYSLTVGSYALQGGKTEVNIQGAGVKILKPGMGWLRDPASYFERYGSDFIGDR